MASGRLWIWLIAGVLVCSSAPSVAEPFPEYDEISGNVRFWTRVFGEWSLGQVAVHDLDYPGLVFEVADLPGPVEERYTDAQSDFVEDLRQGWIDRLRELADKVDSRGPLSDGEKRWALALTEAGGSDALRGAADRVRTQRGLRERFRRGLEISGRYERALREIFRDAGLPEDLVYLPHVESSFQARARSSAGALGVWQFTRGTGRQYLRIDATIDERLDPILAGHGAARYLRNAHDRLGDWALALTSYNHGINGMLRAVEAHGADYPTVFRNYRGRLFGFASKNFYAEFLAARAIAKAPEAYFPEGLAPEAPISLEALRLPRPATPREVARAYGVDGNALIEINPAWTDRTIRLDATMPADAHVWLPAGTLARIAGEGRQPEAILRAAADSARTHRVRSGETLSQIAGRYSVSVASLRAWNGIPPGSSLIRAGQTLTVRQGGEWPRHVVRSGDTLSTIARAYGVGLADLLHLNDIPEPSLIRPGQQLHIPVLP